MPQHLDTVVQRRFLVSVLVELRIDPSCNIEFQRSPIRQRLRDRVQLLLTLRRQGRVARLEFDVREILMRTTARNAAECGSDQRERRRRRLDDQIHERAEDDAADAELRIRKRPRNRDSHVDLSLRIFQQRNCEPNRQVGRVRAVHVIAERQLIDKDMVVGGQLAGIEQVMNIDCERAFNDRIAGVLDRVRRDSGQLDRVRLRLDIDERGRRERIDRSVDIERRAAVDFSVE